MDRQQIAVIREFIAAHLASSRGKLSWQLCEALGWKQAKGALRDVVCRGLLLMLKREGLIELTAVRRLIRGHRRTSRPRPAAVLIDTTSLEASLRELRAAELQQVRRTADEALFNSLTENYHYFSYEQPGGEQSRCSVALVVVGHGPTALLLDRQTGLGAIQRLDLVIFSRNFTR